VVQDFTKVGVFQCGFGPGQANCDYNDNDFVITNIRPYWDQDPTYNPLASSSIPGHFQNHFTFCLTQKNTFFCMSLQIFFHTSIKYSQNRHILYNHLLGRPTLPFEICIECFFLKSLRKVLFFIIELDLNTC
jgi:hypothetical protein